MSHSTHPTRLSVGSLSSRVASLAGRDRDWADVARLLERHRVAMDLSRVRKLVHQLSDAMGEPERVIHLERIVAELESQTIKD